MPVAARSYQFLGNCADAVRVADHTDWTVSCGQGARWGRQAVMRFGFNDDSLYINRIETTISCLKAEGCDIPVVMPVGVTTRKHLKPGMIINNLHNSYKYFAAFMDYYYDTELYLTIKETNFNKENEISSI